MTVKHNTTTQYSASKIITYNNQTSSLPLSIPPYCWQH